MKRSCLHQPLRSPIILCLCRQLNIPRGVCTQSKELLLAFHSFVMADALLAGNSGLSQAASWLSKGWLWAFQVERLVVRKVPTEMTEILWNEKGELHIPKIFPPRWPRSPPRASSV